MVYVDPETAAREIRALKSIDDNYPKYIISSDVITSDIEGIEHINIVDWLSLPLSKQHNQNV